MHHTALLPLFSSVLLFGGLAAAVPVAAQEQCLSQIICVDAINPCGIKYGGYNTKRNKTNRKKE